MAGACCDSTPAGRLPLICTVFIPESPILLIERGKAEAAEKALAWLRSLPAGDGGLSRELSELNETGSSNRAPHLDELGFLSEAIKPDIRCRLLVGVGLMIAQNMVGLNALNYYAPVIFMTAGFTSASSSLSQICGGSGSGGNVSNSRFASSARSASERFFRSRIV